MTAREIHYTDRREMPAEARELVDFDAGSIMQLVGTDRVPDPGLWLVDPDGYEENGHVARDSETIRLIAYAAPTRTVYATDGCNVCRHALPAPLDRCDEATLAAVARDTQLPLKMLRRAAELERG